MWDRVYVRVRGEQGEQESSDAVWRWNLVLRREIPTGPIFSSHPIFSSLPFLKKQMKPPGQDTEAMWAAPHGPRQLTLPSGKAQA